ncbi:MAG: hypothetical protein V3R57_00590 [Candidatus Bathyarchaeia archaeon]
MEPMVKLGRVTPSFRRLLLAEIEGLHKRFRPKLRDSKLQEAFDALIRVWSREDPAMMQSNLPYPFDAMNLLSNMHVRAELEHALANHVWQVPLFAHIVKPMSLR